MVVRRRFDVWESTLLLQTLGRQTRHDLLVHDQGNHHAEPRRFLTPCQ